MASKIIPVDSFDFVIFGATGDLSKRKILPSIYRRVAMGQIPMTSRIIGASRSDLSRDEFLQRVAAAIENFVEPEMVSKSTLDDFLKLIDYVKIDATDNSGWPQLVDLLGKKANEIRAFYFAVRPDLIEAIATGLKANSLVTEQTRVIVEKPLGKDFASARKLNAMLQSIADESKIYRIDHYLGKETVQNLMVLRFANIWLEPIWNNQYIDHLQITVAETVGVKGREGYYRDAGALRDMVQNHMMQLLCLAAMEPPASYDADEVRSEKLKVIRALKAVPKENTARGIYGVDESGESFADHIGELQPSVESYVAIKAEIANWRWAGVPFYLRTGKMLRRKVSEIVVTFKSLPHSIFAGNAPRSNRLVIRLQPDEGVTLHMMVKEPGPGGMRLSEVPLDMTFADQRGEVKQIDAYERLILDAIRGNQTLFMRGDEVEAAWRWTDKILESWDASDSLPEQYDPGSNGPEGAIELLARDRRRWRDLAAANDL